MKESLEGKRALIGGTYYSVCGWTDKSIWVKAGDTISGPFLRADVELSESPKTMREHVLDEAKKCVLKDRNKDYAEPERNFERIADFWNVYLADKLVEDITPHDTAVMAMFIKISRIMQSPDKEDHWTDIAGYAACGAECIVNKPEPGNEREAWDWSEVFKDMGAVDEARVHRCKIVTIKNPGGRDSYMYDNGATLGTNCMGCGARIDPDSIYLSDNGCVYGDCDK